MKKQVIIGGIIIVCGLFIIITNLRDFNIKGKVERGEQAVETYNAAELEKLTIESSSTNIKLLPTDDNEIKLKFYNSANKSLDLSNYVAGNLSGRELTLEVHSTKKWFSLFDFTSETLEVSLPSELLDKLTVESKSGNIEANEIHTLDSVNLEAYSGNVEVANSDTAQFKVSTKSGNIKLEQVNTDEIELEASSGNVKLTSFTAETLSAETKSGNITVKGDAASVNMEASSGNITLDLEQLTANSKLSSSSGNIKLSLEQAGSLRVTHEKHSGSTSISKSGFELLKQDNNKTEGVFGKGEVKLEVETKSGNFKLN